MELLEKSMALQNSLALLLTTTSTEDCEQAIIERESFRNDIQKAMNELEDDIRRKRDEIRLIQSAIERLKGEKRAFAALKADHAVEIEKLANTKWNLIRERKAYNLS